MAALTVSFAGKIGATAPASRARAAGEFPSAPAPRTRRHPLPALRTSPFFPSPAAPLGRPFVVPCLRPRDDANVVDAAARPKRRSWTLPCARVSVAIPGVAPTLAPETEKPIHHGAGATRHPRLDEGADAPERRFRPRTTTDSRPRSPPSPTPASARRPPFAEPSPGQVRVRQVASPPPSRRRDRHRGALGASGWSTTSPRTTPPSPRPGRSP